MLCCTYSNISLIHIFDQFPRILIKRLLSRKDEILNFFWIPASEFKYFVCKTFNIVWGLWLLCFSSFPFLHNIINTKPACYAQNMIFQTMGCLSIETPITCIKIKYLYTWLLIINGPHRTGAIHILIRVSLKFSSFPDDKEKVFCCICRYTPYVLVVQTLFILFY